MNAPLKTSTLALGINCSASEIYKFVSNPLNLPKWATTFAKSIHKANGKWILQTDQGPVKIKMSEKNKFGVLDHFITSASGEKIYVPMRVISNASGSEITFTLFQRRAMTEAQFFQDLKLVKQDLENLKKIMGGK